MIIRDGYNAETNNYSKILAPTKFKIQFTAGLIPRCGQEIQI